MDAQELRNIQEAYMEVVENQQYNEERKPLPTSRMARQARRKAFNAASETHSNETGIGIVARGDKTAKDIRTMARVGGKKVKSHIKKGYEQGRNYDPYYQELNLKNPSRNKYNESYDLYDIILSHLLDEGYAETPEAAKAIMVNMSEEWRESILG